MRWIQTTEEGEANYKDTREKIIQFYGKSPEYHRRKFRGSFQGKDSIKIFYQSAKDYLENWLNSLNISKSYDSLMDLILKEQIMNGLSIKYKQHAM